MGRAMLSFAQSPAQSDGLGGIMLSEQPSDWPAPTG